MPTAAERQALVFLTSVALLGGGVRVWQNRQLEQRVEATDNASSRAENVGDQLTAIDGARGSRKGPGRTKEKSAKAPTAARAPIARALVDIDVANADEIERLPHMNASLAERVVANRDSFGAFGSLTRLARVQGFSKTIRSAVEPWVVFSGPRSHWDGPGNDISDPPHRYEASIDSKPTIAQSSNRRASNARAPRRKEQRQQKKRRE